MKVATLSKNVSHHVVPNPGIVCYRGGNDFRTMVLFGLCLAARASAADMCSSVA